MSTNNFTCPICGNTDIYSIGYLNGKPYCRRCISFRGEEVEHKPSYPKKAPIHLEYGLSTEQKELSEKLVENYKKGIDSLVYAVCGSGKTEIVLSLISLVVSCGGNVGFVIPRRDVVIEIQERLQSIFKENLVIGVYGSHSEEKEGDIICLTSHQLYRYKNYFDLLIIDEIDAFPFKGNDVLEAMFKSSLRGHYVKMSATPSNEDIDYFKNEGRDILKLFKRYHGDYLPVPIVKKRNNFFAFFELFRLLKKYKKQNKPVFIFCPTIKLAEKIYDITKLFFSSVKCVHSKKEDRAQIISSFKKGEFKFLITTSVLERGVTVKDLQVIVMYSDHTLYNEYVLVQIAGRVGRKIGATKGDVIFICEEENQQITNCINKIKTANESLR